MSRIERIAISVFISLTATLIAILIILIVAALISNPAWLILVLFIAGNAYLIYRSKLLDRMLR